MSSLLSRPVISPSRTASILCGTIAALLLTGGSSSLLAADNFWLGTTSNDYNDPTNWSLGHVPAAPDSLAIDTTTPTAPTITVDEPQVVDIRVGEGDNTNGAVLHISGALSSGSGNWTAIGAGSGAVGVYNLTGDTATPGSTSGYSQGSGTLNTNGRLYVGGTDDTTYSGGGTGTLNINTTNGINGSDGVFIGVRGATGTINLEGGTLNVPAGRVLVGSGGTGTLNVSGGALTVVAGNNDQPRIYVGNTGTGVMNVSGGTVTSSSDLVIASNGGTGTVNQTGGIINAGGWAYVGGAFEGATNTGTLNISGGTFNKGGGRMYIGVGSDNNRDTTGQMTVSGTGVFNGTELTVVGTGNTTSTLDVIGGGVMNSGRLVVGGNPFNDAGGTGHGILTVAGATTQLNVAGDMNIGLQAGSTGVLNISGGTIHVTGVGEIGGAGSTGTGTMTGGLLTTDSEVHIGNGAGSNGTFTVSAGTLSSGSWFGVGREGSTGTLNIGGTASVIQGALAASQPDVRFELTNANAGGSATVNLNGGTLSVNGFISNGGTAATTILNFNGTLVRASASRGDFLQGLTAANVQAGGFRFDTNGFNTTINQVLLADTVSTGGGLTKYGAGRLGLGGVATYTGATEVQAGELYLPQGASIGSSSNLIVSGNRRGIVATTAAGGLPVLGGILFVDDGGGTNGTQIGGAGVTLNGGSLEYHGGQGIGLQLSNLTVATGGDVIAQPQSGGGLLAVNNLTTNASHTGTATFMSTYGTLGVGDFAQDRGHITVGTIDNVAIDSVVNSHNGIVGGWATTYSTPDNGGDTVTHFVTNGTYGLTPVAYNMFSVDGAGAVDNVQAGFAQAVTMSQGINALESNDGDLSFNPGVLLTLESGGLILGGASHAILQDTSVGGSGASSITAGASSDFRVYATVNDTNNYQLQNVGIVNNGADAVGFVKGGKGALTLNSANSYTGPTVVNSGTLQISGSLSGTSEVRVNSGATLSFGAEGDKIGNSAPVILAASATLNTGGFSEGPIAGAAGSAAAMGTLTVGADSAIDFGTGATGAGSSLLFAGLNYTPGTTFSILNWTGGLGLDSGAAGNDRLLFSNSTGLSIAQLSSIQFYGDNGAALLMTGAREIAYNGYYELVAVPEPSTFVALGSGLAMLVGLRRRRAR